MARKNATTQIFLILGGIGAAVPAASLRWSGFWRDPAAAWPSSGGRFVMVMNVALVVLGAIFYALFLRWPVNELVRNRRISVGLVLLGGLMGMFATFAALQGRYLAGALYLTYQMNTGVGESGLRSDFLLSIMEIETYGLIELFYFLVPAFLCGVLVTATVSRSLLTKAFPQSNSST
jgi:hypothetical protein